MIIVSDTSSISNLLQIGLADLLPTLYGEIIITPAVKRELYTLPDQEKQIEQLNWIKIKTPKNQQMVATLLEELDLGEAESIALAIEEQAKYLIIDEYKGRKIADLYGISIVGVIGVLIQAKKRGLISSVKMNIEKLTEIGFRLDKQLIEKILTSLKE